MTDDSTSSRDRVTEADVTNADGTRYETLVVDKSGETSDDES